MTLPDPNKTQTTKHTDKHLSLLESLRTLIKSMSIFFSIIFKLVPAICNIGIFCNISIKYFLGDTIEMKANEMLL